MAAPPDTESITAFVLHEPVFQGGVRFGETVFHVAMLHPDQQHVVSFMLRGRVIVRASFFRVLDAPVHDLALINLKGASGSFSSICHKTQENRSSFPPDLFFSLFNRE